MKVVIVAGGQGTRIASVSTEIPKALIPVCGKPVIQRQIELAVKQGFTDIIIILGHLGNAIRECLGDGSALGARISYFTEPFPMGTAGALALIRDRLHEDFFVFYGDTVMDIDLDAMRCHHTVNRSELTLLVHPNSHPYDSDLVVMNARNEVTGFHFKPHPENLIARNQVNAALYIVSPGLLELIPVNEKVSFEKGFMKKCLENGHRLIGYPSAEYIKDMGTPDRYESVQRDVHGKIPEAMNRRTPRPAIFLDRDGVINREVDLLCKPEDVTLIEGAAEAIALINKSGYLAVVVTNQPVIARNLCSLEELQHIHNVLETLLGHDGAYLNALYLCPHHPDAGYPEERKEYKTVCECRKPKPGLILQAAKDLNINLAQSCIIGDRESDMLSGRNAGLKQTILVHTNENGALLNAVREILNHDHV